MLRTRRERVDLLRKGIDSLTIEELYLKHNNIKLVRKPVLFDPFIRTLPPNICKASQFEGKKVEVSHNKTEFLFVTALVVFILAIIFPVTVLFALILGLLFIPPVLAAFIILLEFALIISKEMVRLSVLEKFALVISIIK